MELNLQTQLTLYSVFYNQTHQLNVLAKDDIEAYQKALEHLEGEYPIDYRDVYVEATEHYLPTGAYKVTKEMLTKLLHYCPSDDEIIGHWKGVGCDCRM